MYVCVCNAVTEKDIHSAALNGARRMRDLRGCLGIGTDCGACCCHAKQCLDSALEQQRSPNPASMHTCQEAAA